jgi:N-acetyl-anhydromuramyl-L-alanine amidase AmpD
MEGGLAAAHGVLSGPAQSSWHFSNPKVGPLEQHYAMSRITWHGGSLGANRRYVGIEHEGVAGEPLTASQIENDVALLGWLAENDVQPWPGLIRLDTLWEHNEMTRYGSKATACPSGRIPWQEVIDLATIDTEARRQIAVVNLADRWAAMIRLGLAQQVVNEAKALGVVAQ